MKTFTASRISEGNKIFPTKITLQESGLTVKVPGLFRDQEEYFGYGNISNVKIETPLIGFSSITFFAGDSRVKAHGFTSDEVKEIRESIINKTY